jgi:hypothetical protein
MFCNGICDIIRSSGTIIKVTTRYDKGRYDQGQRWCRVCEFFVYTISENLNLCPCCRSKLRTRPKMMKLKNKFRDRMYSTYKNHSIKGMENTYNVREMTWLLKANIHFP